MNAAAIADRSPAAAGQSETQRRHAREYVSMARMAHRRVMGLLRNFQWTEAE